MAAVLPPTLHCTASLPMCYFYFLTNFLHPLGKFSHNVPTEFWAIKSRMLRRNQNTEDKISPIYPLTASLPPPLFTVIRTFSRFVPLKSVDVLMGRSPAHRGPALNIRPLPLVAFQDRPQDSVQPCVLSHHHEASDNSPFSFLLSKNQTRRKYLRERKIFYSALPNIQKRVSGKCNRQ